MRRLPAPAKLNLALVVGPRGPDGKHELVTVLQRVDLADRVSIERADGLRVDGFADDTLVRSALELLAEAAGVDPGWTARIEKQIPIAAGLGGGSSDAATALRLANETLERPLSLDALCALAAALGADVPFFLRPGPQLGEGDGTELSSLELPQDYWVVLCLSEGMHKLSTGAVYDAFDARGGEAGFDRRRAALLTALERVRRPRNLASLPPNDLASSPLVGELLESGAFRADVSGAGPAVYGLFEHQRTARAAEGSLRHKARTWICVPAWYG
jgi:4-diphosphocytidyl-2-C-methyl-D-erythritol kinase